MNIQTRLIKEWDHNPPAILVMTQPTPASPSVPLGGATGTNYAFKFFDDLKASLSSQQGEYYHVYTWDKYKDENHLWTLVGYEVFRSESSIYDALCVLYYEPVNPEYVIRDCMGEEMAAEWHRNNRVDTLHAAHVA
ncbi:hypothetical protein WA1_18975 [Scytonema hofmannii PCC 7110]|uniref:Uncharacterized protein n=1 Tax=Scytonema hofmannii PCC 7110 TaxID=128403 RepID=A0A139XBQ9_9CYAN|nr:hypothetical protein [Scytonema hofmannii]KYC42086.1 hypothetical protein WA1_18975 [Scytonema hofmannii PCC 7110]